MLRGQSARRRLDQRHPWLLDTAVVLVVALLSLPDLLSHSRHGPFGDTTDRGQFPTAVLVACAVALVVPLWWRRRNPAVTYGIISVVSLVQWSLGVWQQTGMAGLVALYSLALHGSLRVLGWAAALTAAELGLAVGLLAPVEHPFLGLFFLLGTATAAIATGLTLRIRRLYLAALEDRAKRLETEHAQHVKLTSAAERTRIAREMHDIVGHNLSVMVSLADGAAVLAANRGETSADALRVLADTGRQAMRAGAGGFLLKDARPEELIAGIHAVATGDAVVSPRLTRRLLDAYSHQVLAPADTAPAEDPRLKTLTDREREVLVAVGQGWTNTEIAERLVLTESTVKKHVGRVLAKIGARDRIQAVITAYDTGLVRAKS